MSPNVAAPGRSALAVVFGLTVAACSSEGSPRTASQTNWLQACESDAQCGDLQCLCGTCTVSCDADSTCTDLADTSCISAEESGAIALCSGDEPPSPGFCLPRCEGEECPSATACVAGVCSPLPEPSVRVAVDSSVRYQTLVGFGASIGFVQNEIVQHPAGAELYDAMFAGAGIEILRVRNSYGYTGQEDLESTSEIVAGAAESLGHTPTVMLTSWSPPASLEEIPATSEVTRTVFEGIERSAELGALPAEGILRVPSRGIVTVALQR